MFSNVIARFPGLFMLPVAQFASYRRSASYSTSVLIAGWRRRDRYALDLTYDSIAVSTETTRTVTLSRAPRASAWSISRSQVCPGSASLMIDASVESSSSLYRPSLHRRKVSPCLNSPVIWSNCNSLSPPTDRVIRPSAGWRVVPVWLRHDRLAIRRRYVVGEIR